MARRPPKPSSKRRPADPLPRWDDVRLLLAVLRAGSFTAAALALEIEQSTVSRRVAGLEDRLGAPLFDRTPSGLRVTEYGRRLATRAEGVEAQIHAFCDEAQGHEREVAGRVRLATTESMALHVLIPRVLPQLRALYPRLELDILTSLQAVDLLHREADIALRFFRPRRGDLVTKRVAAMETAVLAHRRYAHRKRRKPESFDWVGLEIPGIASQGPESEWFERHVGVSPTLHTNSYLAQLEMVRAGLGVALLTRVFCDLDDELIPLDLGLPPTPSVELWLVTHSSIRSLPRIAAVWELLERELPSLGRAPGSGRAP